MVNNETKSIFLYLKQYFILSQELFQEMNALKIYLKHSLQWSKFFIMRFKDDFEKISKDYRNEKIVADEIQDTLNEEFEELLCKDSQE